MRKLATLAIAALGFGVLVTTAPNDAQARFGATALADAAAAMPSVHQAQYYRRYYAPHYYGGGYYDYRRHGYAGSRDALDTCAYC